MKLLMKIFSLILVIALGCIIVFAFVFDTADVPDYVVQLLSWLITITLPIIIIAFGCYSVQIENSGIFVRILLVYMIFSILISACYTFAPLSDINETLYNVVGSINGFVVQTYLYVFAYILLSMVSPNNAICNIIKKIAIGALIITILAQVFLSIKMIMVDKLPNVYGYDGFNFSTVDHSQVQVMLIVAACAIVEVFTIILTYITNYAFEIDTIDAGDVDYYELKMQADSVAQNKIHSMYTEPVSTAPTQPDRSASEKGLMNVSNQLGQDSNVGQTNTPTSSGTVMTDISIPSSNGPVVNDAINQNNNQQK